MKLNSSLESNNRAMPMMTPSSPHRLATLLLALASLPSASPFTPTIKTSLSNINPTFITPYDPIRTTNLSPSPNSPRPFSSSLLQASFFDDLVSSKDEEYLKKQNDAYLSTLQQRVDRINALEESIEDLSDDELIAKTSEFKSRLAKGEDINGPILEEAFAVVREAAWRVLELRHYDVQLLGGMILHDGRLAEMATGEGKTLVSTLPCYLNALRPGAGSGSYVITVNDYLARRDCEKMGQIHRFLGLSVGLIQSNMKEDQRREAYASDVVYVTNAELGFDYLRDHLALSPLQTVLPGGAGEFDGFCVVDEADSVLIDEARTPLIISKQEPAPATKYQVARQLADALQKNVHYNVDLKNKNVILSEKGYRDAEDALGLQSLFQLGADGEAWAPYVSNAVKAKELFEKDVEYSVIVDKGGKASGVGIIDSFTGRVLDGRRWSDGLHQSIEAKEGIEVSSQSKVIAKVTYQALFRQFSRLSGMTGTAITDAFEFEGTYGLKVTPVPTALPIARRDYPDVVFKTREAANTALVKEIISVGAGESDGRPCLIGTTSVQMSEEIVAKLAKNGIKAQLLNANPLNAAREGEIIAQAGRPGVVTVATNMAGRGTDILLGGCATTMSRLKVRDVMLQQGLLKEGETPPPSPEEEYYPCAVSDDIIDAIKQAAALIKKDNPEGVAVLQLDEMLTVATDTTEAPDEPQHTTLLRDAASTIKETYSAILSEEKEAVQSVGGLYVMGTNRHESSRIDNQLRGRSGRQGDPGTSRFFLSFQDDMFVIFGGDGLQNILKTFRVSDDMPVEAPQVTKSLDKIQTQVEEKYREIRSQILDFDDVLDKQRRVIYSKRRGVLFADSDKTIDTFREYHSATVSDIVVGNVDKETNELDTDKVYEKILQFFPTLAGAVVKEDLAQYDSKDVDSIVNFLTVAVDEVFNAQIAKMDENAKAAGKPLNALSRSANYIALISMDNAWSDHLQNMESLKETVLMRKYQNLDPVAEYKKDAFELFQGLEKKMRLNVVFSLWQSFAGVGSPQAA